MKLVEEYQEDLRQKKLVDGWGRTWTRNYVPEHIARLNEEPIGKIYPKNNYVFSRHLPLKNHPEFRIDVEFEMTDKSPYFRMWTDDLKYGDHLEIVFDGKTKRGQKCSKQCFVIKDIDRLRAEWRRNHPEENVINDVFKEFMEDLNE